MKILLNILFFVFVLRFSLNFEMQVMVYDDYPNIEGSTQKSLVSSEKQEISSSLKEKYVTSTPKPKNLHFSRFYLIRANQKISEAFNDQLINQFSGTKMICFKKCFEYSCNFIVYSEIKKKCQIFPLLNNVSFSEFDSAYQVFSLYI